MNTTSVQLPFSSLEQAVFGCRGIGDLLPGQLYARFVDTSFSALAVPELHPQGQHWSEWKTAGIKPELATEVATNLARATEVREILQQAGSLAAAVLTAPRFLNMDRLHERTAVGQERLRPRIELWAQKNRRGDLQVMVDMTRDLDAEADADAIDLDPTKGTDYDVLPVLNFSGGAANLLAELPAELISTPRGKVASRALVASKEEIARAVVVGLGQLAQDLNVVCDVSIGDWVAHLKGKYIVMSPDDRVSYRLSQVLEAVSGEAFDMAEAISASLRALGLRRKADRDNAVRHVIGAKDQATTLKELFPASPDEAVVRLVDQFAELRVLAEYGVAMQEISAGHLALLESGAEPQR